MAPTTRRIDCEWHPLLALSLAFHSLLSNILTMARRYTETVFLTNGHTQGISCVEFSLDGTLIATGGLDGNLCVWTTDGGRLLHTYACANPITSIAWTPGQRPTIVAGSKAGNIVILVVNNVSGRCISSRTRLHELPISGRAYSLWLLGTSTPSGTSSSSERPYCFWCLFGVEGVETGYFCRYVRTSCGVRLVLIHDRCCL